MGEVLRTLIVDDEPLAVERMQIVCANLPGIAVVGTASDGAQALRLIEALTPDLVLLDITMPEMDGLTFASALAKQTPAEGTVPPVVIFVTAHENFAVEAFDLEAVDYVLKPVAPDRLERAVGRALARRATNERDSGEWLDEFWVPHRSELLRVGATEVDRIDAERDYVRLHVGETSYLLLHTVSGLETRLDPARFIRLHRSCILRRDRIRGLKHDGLGTWSAELDDGSLVRIGRTYLPRAKAMAGR
ncbi:LytR/AlgR family response regulator transcription factor [Novosphingobium sp. JCM 18896]|uniref:LytR/AlgR family response regulator transcription factor n=1 Tax=Novosphingobium sp. JCM 18896 TaxID=2989731 RepID=UPI0022225139|nr:LytTR family DNA-binding domain-containing protein [Novosphingobium sp. JCM 18896]MCW1429246.1 LytTR family DNA-binding domain-containing protein [Novosphingobium sp. JCM 18896]